MPSSTRLSVTVLASALAGWLIPGQALSPSAQTQAATSPFPIIGITAAEREILSHQEIVYLDDGQGGLSKTLRIAGINV
ncbi:MAG: hypothetical protein ACI80N_003916, partial [Gammaproteobacteria bacterium]